MYRETASKNTKFITAMYQHIEYQEPNPVKKSESLDMYLCHVILKPGALVEFLES